MNVAICVVMSLASPYFLTWANLRAMLLSFSIDGIVAVTGGTGVFDLFRPLFTGFDLVRVPLLTIPDGIPCFSAGDPRVVLSAIGLHVIQTAALDSTATLTLWR